MRVISLFIFAIVTTVISYAQELQDTTTAALPEIGKRLPEFSLNNIQGMHGKSINDDDFKGRWKMLYFWGVGCALVCEAFQS